MPEAFAAALASYAGKTVVFGVRPEDIALSGPAGTADDRSITARAEVVETLGSEMFVHLSCGAHNLVARLEMPERLPSVGETLHMTLKMPKTHVFDKETQRAIV